MQSLDAKVFGRDTILLPTDEERQLNGFLSKLNKKRKKLLKKLPITKNIYKAVSKTGIAKAAAKFESKHRKDLKKIGAVAAVVVGSIFAGPAVMAAVKSMGGKLLASNAAKSLATGVIKQKISEKLSEKQQKELQERLKGLTPEQVLADPEVQSLSEWVAASEGAQESSVNPQEKAASAMIATEGAMEISHQMEKVATPDYTKYIVPAASAIAVLLMMRK